MKYYHIIIFLLIISILNSCSYEFTIGSWEDGIIPYYLTGEFSDGDILNINEAMSAWENVCGVRFIKVSPRANAFHIKRVSREVWFSSIGENNSNCQMLFGKTYSDIDVIIHELGHCLGLVHEHQRPDRDLYVSIIWDNILTGKEFNFDIVDNPLYVEQDFPYDYHSIMHYSSVSFSKNGEATIISVGKNEIFRAGGITESDADKAKAIYGPPFDEDIEYE